METTLEVFKQRQEAAASTLRQLLAFIQRGEQVGVALDAVLEQKLESAIKAIAGARLKVALVGGFSEGKTSIVAAWMNRLDKQGMQIDQRESTDDVFEHEVGDDIVLIDTPGLFGFGVKDDGQKYKDVTRKYVSEANLVLYVMDPANPIKESHKSELQLLFRDLALLPRTVFVLSRFDDIADLEDEAAYQSALAIKRSAVRQRLVDLVGLDEQEKDALSIVAVSANPFGASMDHWLKNVDEHRRLSRIATLQDATATKIQANGGQLRLVQDTRTSIIGDVLSKHLPMARKRGEVIANEVSRLADAVQELDRKVVLARTQAGNARGQIRSFISDYFPNLILQARGADMQTWNEFYEREIGAEGVIINLRLQEEYERNLRTVQLNLESVQGSFVEEINHFNSMVSKIGQQGAKHLLDANLINNKSILMIRDGVVSAGRMVGFDVGKSLNFASWGAHKLAGKVNGALMGLGIALEAWDSWQKYEREQQFKKSVDEFVHSLEGQRAGLVSQLVGEGEEDVFVLTYFPDLLEMVGMLGGLKAALQEMSANDRAFQQWYDEANVLQGEYKRLVG